MSQVGMAKLNSSRAIALERRKALSSSGKSAIKSASAKSNGGLGVNSSAKPVAAQTGSSSATSSARAASLARRKAMSTHGKSAVVNQDRVRGVQQQSMNTESKMSPENTQGCGCGCGGKKKQCGNAETTTNNSVADKKRRRPMTGRTQHASNSGKSAALLRRKALSSLGKAGLNTSAVTDAQVARASNPKISGRELAKVLREQRSKNGGAGQKKSAPCGRQRKRTNVQTGAAQDAPWKVGASVTVSGQTVTGTMVGRQENMTGDEPSTCRTITGTEYLGADIFNQYCQNNAKAPNARKVTVTTTSHGNAVSGSRMGRGTNVTGNESGTCKRITGDEYTSAEQSNQFCAELAQKSPRKGSMAETMKGKSVSGNNVGRSSNVTGNEYGMRRRLTGTQYSKSEDIGSAPAKVGQSATLRGSQLTGTMIGRGERVTGNEPGSCRNITGDDYIGVEQYNGFCQSRPQPADDKVGISQTLAGLKVTGNLTARSAKVTGNESGTCKALTGTPYSGADQYQDFCDSSQAQVAQARMQPSAKRWGKSMTGLQPGINGMTGAGKGACENISGTPYVGSDQAAEVCPTVPAEPGTADYPQSIDAMPWGNFSVNSPNHAAQQTGSSSQVTGSRYESGHITGPFGMAVDKVTGTEQARFDRNNPVPISPVIPEEIHGRVKPRITGEGMEAGLKITGDDWDRGDRVTGTEGASATRRNPTMRGNANGAMQMRGDMGRPKDTPEPVSKVTGGSGNTEKGALITYSGGARG